MNDKLTVVTGEERLKTEIDFLDKKLRESMREIEELKKVIRDLQNAER